MKQEWVVLHITDFHIADPASQHEHLRENFFREYLNDLVKVIQGHDITGKKQVDAIVITGDFINFGNRDGLAYAKFAHAQKIIDYLCEKLSVEIKAVLACNGNHDIDRDLEIAMDHANARKEFALFASKYGNGIVANYICRSNFVKTAFDAYALLLDSTINAKGENCPGSISDTEIDEIMDQVRNAGLNDGQLLIVAAHYPTCPYVAADAPFDDSNQDWNAEHMWLSAHPIYARLKKTSNVPVLWLSGDIHRQDHIIEEPIHTVVTGRLGTASGGMASQVRRQARIILVPRKGESRSWLCEFVPSGHRDQAQIGNWQIKEQEPLVLSRRVEQKSNTTNQPIAEPAPVSITLQQEPFDASALLSSKCSPVELLSGELQGAIVGAIAYKKLYSLGRFATSNAESTMAWIPMGALLDQGELLSSLVTQMAKEVKKELADIEPRNPIIIGLDSWGAILASQVSVMTGVKNFCIAGRAKGLTHTASERISETVRNGVLGCDLIILISDVIGTGMSLKGVHNDLSERMSEKQKRQVKWTLLSVICDDRYDRKSNLCFAHANITACKDMRMPILKNDELPSESVLPADISFIRH